MTTPTKNAPVVAATTNEGQVNQSHRKSKGIDMNNATTGTDTFEWPLSNNVTVTEKRGGEVRVVVTADRPFTPSEAQDLVRDLLRAQRLIRDLFEPVPYQLT